MALTVIGKSDLSTAVTTDKEPRIKGQSRPQEEEKESTTKSGKEQPKQEEKVDHFSLQLTAMNTGSAHKVKKVPSSQDDTTEKAESAKEDGSESKAVTATDDTTIPPETLAVLNAASQDPVVLSRWAELARSSASSVASPSVSADTSSKAGDDGVSTATTSGKKEMTPVMLASLAGGESPLEPEKAVALKESSQQRLQAALLSRGVSLSSAIEQASSAKSGAEVRTQSVAAQNLVANTASTLSMTKTELALASTTGTTPQISSPDAGSSPVTSSAIPLPASSTQGHEWSPLKLSSTQSHWGQQLVDTLKERVEMQYSQSIKQAQTRLYPPELGKLDLLVRIQCDKLSVQLNASNPVVRDALLQSSDRLRTSLATEHSGGVEVNVGQGDSQRQQQGAKDEETILAGRRNLMDSESDAAIVDMTGLNALV